MLGTNPHNYLLVSVPLVGHGIGDGGRAFILALALHCPHGEKPSRGTLHLAAAKF